VPNPVIKAQWIFGGAEHGWRETLYFDQTDDNLTTAIGKVDAVGVFRAKLLGDDYFLKATSVKLVVDAAGVLVNGGSRTSRNVIEGATGKDGDDYNVSLLVSFYDATSKLRRSMDLGGIWDEIVVNGGKFIKTPTGWNSAWGSWRNAIINNLGVVESTAQGPAGCGWLRSIKSAPFSVTGYVISGSNQLTFTVAGTPFAGMTPGQLLTVRFSKMAGGNKSVLNGLMPVSVISDTTCQSVRSIAAAPFSSLTGRMFKYTYTLVKAPIINPEEIRTRQRGRPLLVSVGRRGNRAKT